MVQASSVMQLRNARLCLDCEEVHDAQQCPVCASETFAFVTRWVPAPERRGRPRAPEPMRAGELEAYRLMLDPAAARGTPWRRSLAGLAIVGLAGLLWRSASARTEDRAA